MQKEKRSGHATKLSTKVGSNEKEKGQYGLNSQKNGASLGREYFEEYGVARPADIGSRESNRFVLISTSLTLLGLLCIL